MAQPEDMGPQFVGTWSLVSWTLTSKDGETEHPMGEDAVGWILYSGDGYMAAHLMRRQRTPFRSENPQDFTLEERLAVCLEYFSYCGSYTIQQDTKTVTHHVDAACIPNWVGRDQVRNFRFEGNTLTLSLVNTEGSTHTLVWERR